MVISQQWQTAFVAMSAVLGEPLDAIVSAMGDEHAARSAALLDALRAESRQARARAMAQNLAPIAAAVDELELSW